MKIVNIDFIHYIPIDILQCKWNDTRRLQTIHESCDCPQSWI